MEKLELVYDDYKRLVDRYNQLQDGSFADFKIFGILGPVLIGASSILDSAKIGLFNKPEGLFLILLLIILLIFIITFRDVSKQVYINQLGYNIRMAEKYLQSKILEGDEKGNFQIFTLRQSWIEKYYNLSKLAFGGFMIVFVLIILVLPTVILWQKGPLYAIILDVITIALFAIHSVITKQIFEKAYNYEV